MSLCITTCSWKDFAVKSRQISSACLSLKNWSPLVSKAFLNWRSVQSRRPGLKPVVPHPMHPNLDPPAGVVMVDIRVVPTVPDLVDLVDPTATARAVEAMLTLAEDVRRRVR